MFSCNNDVAEKYLHQGGIKGTYQTVFAKKKKKKANKRGKQYEIKIAAIKKEKKKKPDCVFQQKIQNKSIVIADIKLPVVTRKRVKPSGAETSTIGLPKISKFAGSSAIC